MPKFSDSLDRRLEEIKRPPNPPVGHYIWQVVKHPEITEFTSRAGDDFERVEVQCSVVSPCDDVDTDDLEAYGNVVGYRNRKVFLFNNSENEEANFARSEFNLRRFLGHCGIDESMSFGEALPASVNTQFMGELYHKPDANDEEVIRAEIGSTTEVE